VAEREWTADVPAAAVPPPRLSSFVDFSAAEPAPPDRPRAEVVPTPRAAPEDAAAARLPTEVRLDPAPAPLPPPAEGPSSAEVDKAAKELALELAGTAGNPAPAPPRPEKLPISVHAREAGRPAPPASRGWTLVPFLAEGEPEERPTGRMLRVRSIPRDDLPPLRLSLEAGDRRDDRGNAGVEALVDVPEPLAWLDLECRYQLARATGTFLVQNGFPRVERAKLLGAGALDPACVSLGERIMALVTVEGSLIQEARAPARSSRRSSSSS
jgi:hypothetical protein